MARPPRTPTPEPVAEHETDLGAADMTVDDVKAAAERLKTSTRLTPEQIDDLQQAYRDVCQQPDADAQNLTRSIRAKLRRLTHLELHPDCQRVRVDVPAIKLGKGVRFVTINDVRYHGPMELWACEWQHIAYLISEGNRVEEERLREDGGGTFDLDRGAFLARAAAIQAA